LFNNLSKRAFALRSTKPASLSKFFCIYFVAVVLSRRTHIGSHLFGKYLEKSDIKLKICVVVGGEGGEGWRPQLTNRSA